MNKLFYILIFIVIFSFVQDEKKTQPLQRNQDTVIDSISEECNQKADKLIYYFSRFKKHNNVKKIIKTQIVTDSTRAAIICRDTICSDTLR